MTIDTATKAFLRQLRYDLYEAARKHRARQRRRMIVAGIILGAALLAGGAFAAAKAVWPGADMTRADIDRQGTTVVNDRWLECSGPRNHCVTKTGTHKQVTILPSMGVSFVLPDGSDVNIVPADGSVLAFVKYGSLNLLIENGDELPLDLTKPIDPRIRSNHRIVGCTWTVDLSGGGKRKIVWKNVDASVVVNDTYGGRTTSKPLHAGEVVPLIPDSVGSQVRSLEKAVTVDLPPGNRVIIFPTFNETYFDGVSLPRDYASLAPGDAARYGLKPIGKYKGELPVRADGGSWTARLPGGTERTISWKAGQPEVTISDVSPSGGVEETIVPIGHEIPLIPFR
ncbi:MAG: hypothetical protein WBQ14_11135 [Gaiellaceae bacterium]